MYEWVKSIHEFSGISAEDLAVRVGSSAHASGGSIIKLKRYVQHEKYNPMITDFDYSLLELAEPLTFNKAIRAITLPDADTRIADGTKCRVSGWGKKSWSK